MNAPRIRIGVIGAGDVTRLYLADLDGHDDLELLAIGDRNPDRAEERASRYGIPRHGDVESVLGDPEVDLVLNLTSPASHLSITRAALERGKHVFSEKPLGTDLDEARAVLDLAAERGLVIACAPDSHLWTGFQDALRLLADGAIGSPVFARAEAVLAGPESWHPRPQFLYANGGGPLLDIGPYFLTTMVAALGPVRRVHAVGTAKSPARVIGSGPLAGTEFPVEVPSLSTAILEFASGIAADLLLTFDSASHRGGAFEILGTAGTLRTPNPNDHAGTASLLPAGSTDWARVPLGDAGASRPVGLISAARHLRGLEPLRVGADLAFHVLETMLAIEQSMRSGRAIAVRSRCEPPQILPAGWHAGLRQTPVPVDS